MPGPLSLADLPQPSGSVLPRLVLYFSSMVSGHLQQAGTTWNRIMLSCGLLCASPLLEIATVAHAPLEAQRRRGGDRRLANRRAWRGGTRTLAAAPLGAVVAKFILN